MAEEDALDLVGDPGEQSGGIAEIKEQTDFPLTQPHMQKRVAEHAPDQAGPGRAEMAGHRCRPDCGRKDGRTHLRRHSMRGLRPVDRGDGGHPAGAIPAAVPDQQNCRVTGHARAHPGGDPAVVEVKDFPHRQRLAGSAQQGGLSPCPGGGDLTRRRGAEHEQTVQVEYLLQTRLQPVIPQSGAIFQPFQLGGKPGGGGCRDGDKVGAEGGEFDRQRQPALPTPDGHHGVYSAGLRQGGEQFGAADPPHHARRIDEQRASFISARRHRQQPAGGEHERQPEAGAVQGAQGLAVAPVKSLRRQPGPADRPRNSEGSRAGIQFQQPAMAGLPAELRQQLQRQARFADPHLAPEQDASPANQPLCQTVDFVTAVERFSVSRHLFS